jgi:hypothetical protein
MFCQFLKLSNYSTLYFGYSVVIRYFFEYELKTLESFTIHGENILHFDEMMMSTLI